MDYQNFCESYTYRHAFVSYNETSGGGFLGKWHKRNADSVDATVPPAWASTWAPLLDTPVLKRTTVDYSPWATGDGSYMYTWAILWPWCRLSQAGTECATGPFHRADSFTLFAVADVVDIDSTASNYHTVRNRVHAHGRHVPRHRAGARGRRVHRLPRRGQGPDQRWVGAPGQRERAFVAGKRAAKLFIQQPTLRRRAISNDPSGPRKRRPQLDPPVPDHGKI
jgi:hypothetical protein